MTTLIIMLLGMGAGRFFPASKKKLNEQVQLLCTLLLIFSMGVGLGQQEDFFPKLGQLGIQSFLFFLIPTIFSVIFVYFLTSHFMAETEKNAAADAIPIAEAELHSAEEAVPYVTLYPGCLKTPDACKAYANLPNYGGFPFVPGDNPLVRQVV